MVAIRLARHGGRNDPFYRVVATDTRHPRDGRHLEVIGFWRPTGSKETIELNAERLSHWLSVGAQPSDTVKKLIKTSGVLRAAATTA